MVHSRVYSASAATVQDLREVSRLGLGFFWENGQLMVYDPPPSSLEYLRVDMECAKLEVLKQLLEQGVDRYDVEYKALREAFRDLVTSRAFEEPIGQMDRRSPAEWLALQLPPSAKERFNVLAFVRESKLGPSLEHGKQYFTAQSVEGRAFVDAFLSFVGPKDASIRAIGRHALFDLKRTDDVFYRMTKHNPPDLTAILHTLSVFLAKPCVLLRLHINYAYPNLAMWLHLLEDLEEEQRRILSPFFPPPSKDAVHAQLMALGFMDDLSQYCTAVYDDTHMPPPQDKVVPPDEEELRLSRIFFSLFRK